MHKAGEFRLTDLCDAVVVLAMTDWRQDHAGNRRIYGTRFAACAPVVFVQPDVYGDGWFAEPSDTANLTLLHVNSACGERQCAVLAEALRHMGIERPLLWVYNPHMHRCVKQLPAALKVYHATEDYVNFQGVDDLIAGLHALLPQVALVVSVSARVEQHLLALGLGNFRPLLLPNGCDYAFWALDEKALEDTAAQKPRKNLLYAGNINRRLDYGLLEKLVPLLPEWEFTFCGPITEKKRFQDFRRRHSNVRYKGKLPQPRLKEQCLKASAALIPFVADEENRSLLPLKAFEYLATGLPVVCSDLEALQVYGNMFSICHTPEEYAAAVRARWRSRYDEGAIRKRMACAAQQDYDKRFAQLMEVLADCAASNAAGRSSGAAAAPLLNGGAKAPVPALSASTFARWRRSEQNRRRRIALVCALLPEGSGRWRVVRGLYHGTLGRLRGRPGQQQGGGTDAPPQK